jgi:dTDP-4-dehydrorhamnose reductase
MRQPGSYLIVGGDGFLGQSLAACLTRGGATVLATTRRLPRAGAQRPYLDLQGPPEGWQLPEQVDIVIICAAITSLEACAKDPRGAGRVNVEAPLRLAEHYAARQARIVFYSSNQVFDGTRTRPLPEDPVRPVTEYGRHKAQAERLLLSRFGEAVAVLRLTKVWGDRVPLLEAWSKALAAGETIRPFSDMFLAPIPLATVLSVTRLVAEEGLSGILQISADKDLSYAQVARMACRLLDLPTSLVKPRSARRAKPDLGPFPRQTALDVGRLRQCLGVQPPPVEWTVAHTLGQYLAAAKGV